MGFQSETSVFKFLQRSVDGKHLMRFQSETSVFKFLQRSVDGKHLMHFHSETSVSKFKFLRRCVNRRPLILLSGSRRSNPGHYVGIKFNSHNASLYWSTVTLQVRCSVHTKPDKFENATFFIRIGLPSTLKRRFRCPKTELFENALQSG